MILKNERGCEKLAFFTAPFYFLYFILYGLPLLFKTFVNDGVEHNIESEKNDSDKQTELNIAV